MSTTFASNSSFFVVSNCRRGSVGKHNHNDNIHKTGKKGVGKEGKVKKREIASGNFSSLFFPFSGMS